MKRTLLTTLAATLLMTACGPDPLIGSYNFTISGLDTTTAPSMQTTTPSGTGTLAVTGSTVEGDYVMTVADNGNNPCLLKGNRGTMGQTILIKSGQTCTFNNGLGNVTASMSSGTATLTDQTMSLLVSYSFAGTTLGVNYSGTGTRTYAGPRL